MFLSCNRPFEKKMKIYGGFWEIMFAEYQRSIEKLKSSFIPWDQLMGDLI